MIFRFLVFALKAAIVIVATWFVYDFVHSFVWNGLGFASAYLGSVAAAMVAGTIAVAAGVVLLGVVSQWDPWIL